MEDKYRPYNLNGHLAQVSEECSELIQAVCKVQRFGIHNYHPRTKESNLTAIIREYKDVKKSMDNLMEYLQSQGIGVTKND